MRHSISVDIGVTRTLIIDTGSNVSILQPNVSGSDVGFTTKKPHGVTGEALDIKGIQSVSFSLRGRKYTHAFLVCPLTTEAAGLLGTDFLENAGAKIDLECGTLSLAHIGRVPRVFSVPRAKHTALTVFAEGKAGCSPVSRRRSV
jgi:hypothetical protein